MIRPVIRLPSIFMTREIDQFTQEPSGVLTMRVPQVLA
jgi:hypothetical protein